MKYRLEACGVAGLIVAHMCRDTSQATMVQGIIKYGLIRIRIRIRMYYYVVRPVESCHPFRNEKFLKDLGKSVGHFLIR